MWTFGVWGHPDAARLTYFGLHALQHRGQEGAGILVNNKWQTQSSSWSGSGHRSFP